MKERKPIKRRKQKAFRTVRFLQVAKDHTCAICGATILNGAQALNANSFTKDQGFKNEYACTTNSCLLGFQDLIRSGEEERQMIEEFILGQSSALLDKIEGAL